MLLLEGGHLIIQQRGRVGGTVYDRFILRVLITETVTQLDGRLDLGRLGRADTFLLAKLLEAGPADTSQSLELSQQPLSHLDGIFTLNAYTQEDGHQFSAGKDGSA